MAHGNECNLDGYAIGENAGVGTEHKAVDNAQASNAITPGNACDTVVRCCTVRICVLDRNMVCLLQACSPGVWKTLIERG